MKKLLLTLLIFSSLAIAAPANAQSSAGCAFTPIGTGGVAGTFAGNCPLTNNGALAVTVNPDGTKTNVAAGYVLPNRGTVQVGCLWGPGCAAGTNPPQNSQLSAFRQEVFDKCGTAGYTSDQCNFVADSAFAAAKAYNSCADASGSVSSCSAAADGAANSLNGPLQGPLQDGKTLDTLPANSTLVKTSMGYTPLEPLPYVDYSGQATFCSMLNGLFRLLIFLGGLIAVGSFVYAGITRMTSDIPGVKMNAKNSLQTSLWGLLLLISSYIILNTINPQLLSCDNVLNPVNEYSTVATPAQPTPATCTNGVGPGCLTQADQAAIAQVQQNYGLNQPANQATKDAVAELQTTEATQRANCLTNGGDITINSTDCHANYPNSCIRIITAANVASSLNPTYWCAGAK